MVHFIRCEFRLIKKCLKPFDRYDTPVMRALFPPFFKCILPTEIRLQPNQQSATCFPRDPWSIHIAVPYGTAHLVTLPVSVPPALLWEATAPCHSHYAFQVTTTPLDICSPIQKTQNSECGPDTQEFSNEVKLLRMAFNIVLYILDSFPQTEAKSDVFCFFFFFKYH